MDICFQSEKQIYQAFKLCPSEHELFIHLCYSSQHRKFKNLDTQKETRRPDHFSWHFDGTGHLKIKKGHKIQRGSFHDGSFLPKNKTDFSPLFILSYIRGQETWEAQHIQTINTCPYLFNIGELEKFSIVCFLIPCSMQLNVFQHLYASFTNEYKTSLNISMSNIFYKPINYLRFSVYPDHDILIFVSDLINLDLHSTEKLRYEFKNEGYFSATFVDIDKALSRMLFDRFSASLNLLRFTSRMDEEPK
ncbi:MAG: hypothetical protein ACH350_09840 [Parachlamydiaceae bacterium]